MPQDSTAKESCGVQFVQDWSKFLSLCYICKVQYGLSLSTSTITQFNITWHACIALIIHLEYIYILVTMYGYTIYILFDIYYHIIILCMVITMFNFHKSETL